MLIFKANSLKTCFQAVCGVLVFTAPWRKHLHCQFRLSRYDFMTGTLEVTVNLCVINRFIKHERSAWLYYTDLQVVSQSRCSFVCLLVITWQQAWWLPAQSLRPALVINLIKSLLSLRVHLWRAEQQPPCRLLFPYCRLGFYARRMLLFPFA